MHVLFSLGIPRAALDRGRSRLRVPRGHGTPSSEALRTSDFEFPGRVFAFLTLSFAARTRRLAPRNSSSWPGGRNCVIHTLGSDPTTPGLRNEELLVRQTQTAPILDTLNGVPELDPAVS